MRPQKPAAPSGLGRRLFFLLVVRPIVMVVLGLNVRHRARLPRGGPAIVVANHNSHLDALVLMTLFPQALLSRLRPVAAADYFLRNRLVAWFALRCIGILPIDRRITDRHADPMADIVRSLQAGDIVILFPEGTRGEPEQLEAFKSGIAHLAKRCPEVPVHPVYMHGLGKALPRGEALLVPFFCDVFVGEPLHWGGDKRVFMHVLNDAMHSLADAGGFAAWE